MNLVGNAIKFTAEGGVRVSALPHEGTPAAVLFSVADTGIGIAREMQEKVFDAFTQGDGSTSRRYGGTGLGLAISRHLVELMGGRIWVESAPGEGATFRFSVPLPRLPAGESGTFRLARATTPAPWPAARTARILLAEDDAISARLATRMLEKAGHTVTVVGTGRAALERLGSETFDLVVMDLAMPEMDGLEATRRLRERERTAGGHVPVVALTASAMTEDVARCRAAGMDGTISKPFDFEKLNRAVVEVLGRSVDGPHAGGTRRADPP